MTEIKKIICENCKAFYKKEIENLEKDKEQIIFETDLKIKALEDAIETQKSINKDYVDEVYNYQKELEECEIEYQSLVDFVNEKNPALLQEYAIQRLCSKGATVIKLKGGD